MKTIGNMKNFCFGRNTIFILLINLINYGRSATVPNKDDLFRANVTMKNFETTQEDEYACVQYQIPDEELYIVGYSPLITMNSAHHMLTYACGGPASKEPSWVGAGPCTIAQMIIHGWARNAPALNLPEDVGFAVGRNTPYKYIVLNIHYLSIIKNDNSGNQIIFSRTPRKYHAGVMLGGSGDIYLPPKTHGHRARISCEYPGPPISIFAVRVHAHQWGRVNSLYRVRDGKISQIIKSDPQWPQSFYPLPDFIKIEKGDYIVGQCVYDNNDDRTVQVGATHNDEMCNIYAMYSFEVTKTSDGQTTPDKAPFETCWGDQNSQMSSMIPEDSLVPPLKPADIGGSEGGHHVHSEHGMNLTPNIEKQFSNDDQSYEDYVDEVEHLRSRNRGRENFDINKILSNLGLPEYEYVDADNYDYLLPKHLTYGKEQTVKLHNAKIMSCEI
jgi:peptidylglycine monooxygenase